MNKELMEALNILEREKDISKETLFDAIENSLITACKNHFGKSDNVKVEINRETCDFRVFAEKTVVDEVEDPVLEISLADAKLMDSKTKAGEVVEIDIKSKEFGRIATQNAKNVILQKIREEERTVLYNQYYGKEKDVVTGIVQRYVGKNISIDLGKADAMLSENEQVKTENLRPTERVKVYILEVKDTTKGPKILVSRTHPELVKRLFESEVTEVHDGTVEIKAIAREAGSRTKIAVWSHNPDVDPVGACVGMNGARVNAIVDELHGEKIDIINWDENPGILIENALSPAKVVFVIADGDEKTAKVIVPDTQLSLAIGKEGQNARLAARLTGFKIDIKSETQAKDAPGFRLEDYYDDEEEYEEEPYEEGFLEEGSYEEAYEGEGYEGEYSESGEVQQTEE
ncbi:MAG: transcription termination factor NusA [Lachnospiraceae bacterium]